MRETAEKLRRLERSLAERKGPFELFALFLRDGAPGVWDIVVAAKWLDADRSAGRTMICQRVQKLLGRDVTKIARVVVLPTTSPSVAAIAAGRRMEHGLEEVGCSTVVGMDMRGAFYVTSRPRKAA